MNLKSWRTDNGMSVEELAVGLGLSRSARTVARIEAGAVSPDADMIERISVLTGGAVGPDDMHRTRLSWLRRHRPDKFSGEAA